jgi:hypothetical protein
MSADGLTWTLRGPAGATFTDLVVDFGAYGGEKTIATATVGSTAAANSAVPEGFAPEVVSWTLDGVGGSSGKRPYAPVSVSSAAITITGLSEGGADATRDVSGDFTLATAYAASGASGVGSPVLTGSDLTVSPGIEGQTGSVVVTGSAASRAPASITYSWTVGAASVGESIADDRIWSWHNNPEAAYDPAGYIITPGTAAGNFLDDGSVRAAQYFDRWDVSTGQRVSTIRFGTHIAGRFDAYGPEDDHCAPAGIMNSTGRFVAVGTAHEENQTADSIKKIWCAWSTDADPANLGAVTEITTTDYPTYTQLLRNGTTLYLLVRESDFAAGTGAQLDQYWTLYRNASDGDPTAWVKSGKIFAGGTLDTRLYGNWTLDGSGNLIGVCWEHPTIAGSNRGKILTGFSIDPDSIPGTVTTPADLTAIYTPGAGDSSRVLAVNHDLTQILYGRFTIGDYDAGYPVDYYLLRLTGSDRGTALDWTDESLGLSTESFFYKGPYLPGGQIIGIGATETKLYLAHKNGDGGHLEYWARPDDATAWTKSVIINDNEKVIARPIAAQSYASPMVVFHEIDYYNDMWDWKSRAAAAVGTTAPDISSAFEANSKIIDVVPLQRYDDGSNEPEGDDAVQARDFDLSAAEPGDVLVVGISWLYSAGTSGETSATMTVGGVSATRRAERLQAINAGSQMGCTSIFTITCPSGGWSSAETIEVTFAGGRGWCTYSPVILRDVTETPLDTATVGATDSSADALSATIDHAAGGVLFGHVYGAPYTTTGQTRMGNRLCFDGAAEVARLPIGSSSVVVSCAADTAYDSTAETADLYLTSINGVSGCLVSFEPAA